MSVPLTTRACSYATSKGGLKTLTNALAVELGPLGIRVNAVRTGRTHVVARCLKVSRGCKLTRSRRLQVLPAATNTPMLRAGFANDSAGACLQPCSCCITQLCSALLSSACSLLS